MGIKHVPELYRLRTSKIKYKNVREARESDVADCIVQETQKKAKEVDLDNLFGGI